MKQLMLLDYEYESFYKIIIYIFIMHIFYNTKPKMVNQSEFFV